LDDERDDDALSLLLLDRDSEDEGDTDATAVQYCAART
jgi:hypothetical protein